MSFFNNCSNNYYPRSTNSINSNIIRNAISIYGNIDNLNRAVYTRFNESKSNTSYYYCPSDSKSANSYGSCVSRAYYGIQPGITSIIR